MHAEVEPALMVGRRSTSTFERHPTIDNQEALRVPGEPGSHIGGKWVEVDQANMPSANNVETIGTDDVNRMQRSMQINTNASMPGH
jgi:hypothetical protein